ncbi:glycosyltransferase family 9 protein [Fimbriimonas ginsengisoli]|uniref:Lipopolysaccharide heptosyltransferase II n=1 Tax=Fimbriimonas ginsengisoli Gsoil 348 TaxID=661478 RepID=A0A068NX77_FIMGI|nr:glycosyltransferase family 9 protein [Fimbriimonas ginsengisoli]AIE88103.1 lipopolysaccharide heptosyltransferase II [Fimbriimonas ginsengisoli Gsoil 348]
MHDDRILLFLKSYIGDAVMTLPLAELLGTSYRSVSVMTSKLAYPVFWSPRYAFSYLALERSRSPWAVVQKALAIRREGFSTAILVNRSFRTALVSRLAGIPRRIGHSGEGRDPLLSHTIPYAPNRFEAYCALDLAKPLGLPVADELPSIYLTAEERAEGLAALAGATVGLQPGARFPAKQLPLETTTSVATDLQRRGYRLAFLGGPEEAEDARRVAESLPDPVVDLVGKTSIRQTIGALAGLRAMVGNDTGVMHLAAAAGCPVVQVFGPTPAEKWGHAYGRNQVLQAPEGKMERIEPRTVLAAALEVLEGA